MREILGRRRMTRPAPRNAALSYATQWQWPLLPGTTYACRTEGPDPRTPVCSCADPACSVPGAHPADPVLLAATSDARMVDWWWTRRPDAALIMATGAPGPGGRAPCALSLPAVAGARALREFERLRVRVGPVLASRSRWALLVAPYDLAELGELLSTYDAVPSSLRFHGDGGYVALPPSDTGLGAVRWERRPVVERGRRAPWLPRMSELVEVLVEQSSVVPDSGGSLAY
ncbi:bifunctional DNA primase/polymerase [Streptomyces oceani]|uniref:DNA primase n=1 Tax=Streptomyces oceani TaxID=1075402 RepID=A0A1E7JWK5_9ACTN|nr:bifunctional DNA primase/polymerase [Streptomyces oceani]OEU96039.1 DNA primase [Streptomyces oceani]